MASILGSGASSSKVGPHPSFIEVSKQYMTEHQIQRAMKKLGLDESRENQARLHGVAWIDRVRKAMNLPFRTFNTAVVIYHKFRLQQPETSYDYRDAAVAALFNACKVEDTLKKSKEILCAAWNVQAAPSERLIPDNPTFDAPSKVIIGLERLMLEAYGFDFRTRHPNRIVIKLMKASGFDKDSAGLTGHKMTLDLYRTFAPLKQTSATLAFAVLELSARLHKRDLATIRNPPECDAAKWHVDRAATLETLFDLLDLYTHSRSTTLVGIDQPLEVFINIRIELNQEAAAANIARYTAWPKDEPLLSTPASDALKRTPNGEPLNGKGSRSTPVSPQSPGDVNLEDRTRDSTVRFMLDPQQALAEKSIVNEFFQMQEEEVTAETRSAHASVPPPAKSTPRRRNPLPAQQEVFEQQRRVNDGEGAGKSDGSARM